MNETGLNLQNDHTGALPGDQGVLTVTTDGRPARRFVSPEGVYNCINAMTMSDAADAQTRAMVQGMIDGNPPYNQEELDKAGLGDMINVNWHGLRGSLESRLGILDQMLGMDTRLIELAPRNPGPDPDGLRDLGDVIADQFSMTLHDWNGLHPLMEAVLRDMDAHGLGVSIFPNEYDWRPTPMPRGSLRTAENAPIDIDDNEVIAVEGTLYAGDLFRVLEQKTAGWDLETTREYLIQTFVEKTDNTSQGGNDRSTTLVESFNARMRDNVWYDTNQFQIIRVIHVYAKEVDPDGGVTHIIVPANRVGTIGWLYHKEKVYDNLSDAVWWMPAVSNADGRLRSLRGLATYLAPLSHLDNVFLSHAVDIGWRASSLVLQPQSKVDASSLRFVDYGPYTILPPELKVVGNAIPANGMDALLQLRELSQNVGVNNALGLKLSSGTPFAEHRTGAGTKGQQKELQAAQAAAMSADRHGQAIRMRATAVLFRSIFKRMVSLPEKRMPPPARKLAKAFKDSCYVRGITKEQLLKFDEIFVVGLSREFMLGGPAAFVQAMGSLMQFRPGMDEEGSSRLMRDLMSPIVGRRNIDRYRPVVNRENLSTSAQSMAQLENNTILDGHAPAAGRDQQHRVHIKTHSGLIQPIMQAMQQGQISDAKKAATTMQLSLQHIFQHIQMFGMDPAFQEEAQKIAQDLQPAVQAAQKIQQVAQQQAQLMARTQMAQAEAGQQQAQATQQLATLNGTQLTPELMVEKYKIDKQDAVSRLEQESLNNMRAEKTAVQNRIRLAEAQNKLALDRLMAQSKAQAGAGPEAPQETDEGGF